MSPSTSRFFRALIGATLFVAVSAGAASRLLPASAVPQAQRTLVADQGARAFDHVRAARHEIEALRPFEARIELAQARSLLADALDASPAITLLEDLSALTERLLDPSQKVRVRDLDPLLAAIDASGDAEAYGATTRYVERARYQLFYGHTEAAASELVSAAARVPYAEFDGPLSAGFARVTVALIELQAGRLPEADAILADAENSTLTAVRIASGEISLPDVAAPPPAAAPQPAPEAAPAPPSESEIAPPSDFQESPPAPSADAASAAAAEAEAAMEDAASAESDAVEAGTLAGEAMEAAEAAGEATDATGEAAAMGDAAGAEIDAIEAGAAADEAMGAAEAADAAAGEAADAAAGEAADAAASEAAGAPTETPAVSAGPADAASDAAAEAAAKAGAAMEDAAAAAAAAEEAAEEAIEPDPAP